MKHPKIGALLLGLLLSLSACALLPKEEELPDAPLLQRDDGTSYEFAEVLRGDFTIRETVECRYRANREAKLTFEDEGALGERIYVNVGQSVEEGDLLAEADNEALKSQVAEQQHIFEDARRELRQLQEQESLQAERIGLLERAAAAEEKYQGDLAEARQQRQQTLLRIQTARETANIQAERLSELRIQLRETQIYAPFDGIIMDVYQPNELTWIEREPGEPLCVIADFSKAFFVSETDDEAFTAGQTVKIAADGKDVPYTTTVVSCETGGGSKYITLFELTEPDFTLGIGQRGTIETKVQEYEDVLYLPSAVLQERNGQTFVSYLDEKGIRREKEVTTGVTADGRTEITGGAEEGERVLR